MRLRRGQIELIRETVALFPKNSRRELSRTICENLNWHTTSGSYREQFCLRVLERFEELGLVSLPETRQVGGGRLRPVERTPASDPGPPVDCPLSELEPVTLELVSGTAAMAEWREVVDRYHPRGYRSPVGRHCGYWITGKGGVRLGCLMFEASAALACRDGWIGWTQRQRDARLGLVLRNSRFLVLPWVRVRNLASRALSLAARRVASDWQDRWGETPVLAETFVDTAENDGASYRAANWQSVGQSGTGKEVLVLELEPEARTVLREGRPKAERRTGPDRAAEAAREGTARLWSGIAAIVADTARRHDREWRVRHRTVGTFLVMMFVYRLVFGEGRTYAAALDELWESRRSHGAFEGLQGPVTPSAMTRARARVSAAVFREAHEGIIALAGEGGLWNGRRAFVVDGCKLNLPRPLVEEGFATPGPSAHYPQGLASCLFETARGIPVDFDLHAHTCERRAAVAHMRALSAGDVVVYDRGYYSFGLLAEHADRGLDAVFRLKRDACAEISAFRNSTDPQRTVTLTPPRNSPARGHAPLEMRLLRYGAGGTEFIIGTTLTDSDRFPASDIRELYRRRWSIEELYKTSKRSMRVESFTARSGNGVRQEFYAHLSMIAATRLSTDRLESEINAGQDEGPGLKAGFGNALGAVFRNLEALMLVQTDIIGEAVERCLKAIARCMQRERPGRSYPRISRKPVSRWVRT